MVDTPGSGPGVLRGRRGSTPLSDTIDREISPSLVYGTALLMRRGNTHVGSNPAISALEGSHPAVHPVLKTGGGLSAVGIDTSTFC